MAEQILRRIAHYRNGSLYYRTLEGAKVTDCWMSVSRTAEKAGVNVFDYLVALLERVLSVSVRNHDFRPFGTGFFWYSSVDTRGLTAMEVMRLKLLN